MNRRTKPDEGLLRIFEGEVMIDEEGLHSGVEGLVSE